MKNIIFIAPPAAGKGTMSSILEEKYGYAHVSTGELLRDGRNDGTERAKIIIEAQDSGGLVPDYIVDELLKERLQKDDCKKGFILDGYPRSLDQANKYDEILSEINVDLGVVIYLDTPRELLEKRITGRRLCPKCNSTYNILTGVNTPKVENTCDKCGEELYQRSDDNTESFNARYQTYLDKTYPLLDYYEKKNVLYRIKSVDIDNTMKEIEAIIND